MPLLTQNAVDVVGISKRFRFPSAGREATLKDLAVRRVHRAGRYSIVNALDDVTFSVGRGETLGVVGENGSGKTTLLRILAGVTKPDRGEVRMRGTTAPLLGLGAGFNPFLSGRENALIELLTLGLSRSEAKRQLPEVVEFSELEEFIDAPVRTYSSGMAMRLAFAAAIRVDPEILLIDEVLSVGDERFAAKCTAWLDSFRRRGKTTIMVTHDSAAVVSQCDTALWLEQGRAVAFGKPLEVVRAYLSAKSGRPVAETLGLAQPGPEALAAMAAAYRERIANLLPKLRLPLIGFVRQVGSTKGAYEDGWTDGLLEFTVEPLRDVRGLRVRSTVPAGMPEGNTMELAIDGVPVETAPVSGGAEVVMQCDVALERGKAATIRVVSSATVNHSALGFSDDLRDFGVRVDEIVFDHD